MDAILAMMLQEDRVNHSAMIGLRALLLSSRELKKVVTQRGSPWRRGRGALIDWMNILEGGRILRERELPTWM